MQEKYQRSATFCRFLLMRSPRVPVSANSSLNIAGNYDSTSQVLPADLECIISSVGIWSIGNLHHLLVDRCLYGSGPVVERLPRVADQ